ncbi:hypothetical protein PCASD_09323 [Puccinia coronata f. sp. avenae]|uniref:GmrSD restriction endonucleases N-terminal domain-containing protein n=1 Tax=Puccinia coronata f. sp. avenae TaxID=200324 RepID=A0A2N5USH9_9BASI|nr:hypothetical protein PCASD_09323 [Puccinia coronata f. sp. avenae]
MPAGYVTDSESDTDQLDCDASEVDDGENGIPGALESANCRVYSTMELYRRMTASLIDVEPPYQRDVVWTKPSQSALIDSILKNKWVPTLLFSERPASVDRFGKKCKARWVCMDGKQRLTSIRLFMDGVIPWYRKPKEPLYFKQSTPPQPSRKLLTEDQQEIFLTRGLTAAMYSKLTELQERDIFRLVQEGKPLTAGEKMHASSGLWSVYVSELTAHYMDRSGDKPNGWRGRIANLKRGADFRTMAEMVMAIRDRMYNASNTVRYCDAKKVHKELDTLHDTPVPEELQNRVKYLLDCFMDLSMLAPPKTPYTIEMRTPDALFYPIQKGRRTMIAPIEMVWIPHIIAVHSKGLSKGKLLEMIEMYKLAIRKHYPNEVKSNSTITKWSVDWIENFDVSKLTGKYTGWAVPRPTPQPAPQETISTTGLRNAARRTLTVQTSTKRDPSALDPALTPSSSVSTSSLTKRPRLSAPALANQNAARSPIPFQPQRNSLSKDSPLQPRPVSQGRSSTGASTAPLTTSVQARILAQRAQAALNGNSLSPTGSSMSLTSVSNGQQSTTASSLSSHTSAHHAADPGTSRLGMPPARFVSNYPAPPSRTVPFQLPSKPPAQLPQQTTNGIMGYRVNPHSNLSNHHPNIQPNLQSNIQHPYQGQQHRGG